MPDGNCTVPVGPLAPTLAVSVTEEFNRTGVADEVNVIAAAALETVMVDVAEPPR